MSASRPESLSIRLAVRLLMVATILITAAIRPFAATTGETAAAVARTVAPHYLELQYAGHTGWLSLGAGYSFWHGRVETEILYGYVPRFLSDKPVHTIAQKTVVAPARLRLNHNVVLFPVLGGYSVNYVPGKDYFLFPPDRYPRKDYYWPTALHLSLFTGTKVQRMFTSTSFPSAAAAVLQVGLSTHYWRSYTYSDRVGLEDILSLSLGAQTYF